MTLFVFSDGYNYLHRYVGKIRWSILGVNQLHAAALSSLIVVWTFF